MIGVELVSFFFNEIIDLFFMAGVMTAELRSFLELNLPKVKEGKKPKFSLGTSEPKLGSHILEATKIPCQSNEFVLELLRGVRLHFDRFIKDLKMSTLLFLCVWFTVYALCAYSILMKNLCCYLLNVAWWSGKVFSLTSSKDKGAESDAEF